MRIRSTQQIGSLNVNDVGTSRNRGSLGRRDSQSRYLKPQRTEELVESDSVLLSYTSGTLGGLIGAGRLQVPSVGQPVEQFIGPIFSGMGRTFGVGAFAPISIGRPILFTRLIVTRNLESPAPPYPLGIDEDLVPGLEQALALPPRTETCDPNPEPPFTPNPPGFPFICKSFTTRFALGLDSGAGWVEEEIGAYEGLAHFMPAFPPPPTFCIAGPVVEEFDLTVSALSNPPVGSRFRLEVTRNFSYGVYNMMLILCYRVLNSY